MSKIITTIEEFTAIGGRHIGHVLSEIPDGIWCCDCRKFLAPGEVQEAYGGSEPVCTTTKACEHCGSTATDFCEMCQAYLCTDCEREDYREHYRGDPCDYKHIPQTT